MEIYNDDDDEMSAIPLSITKQEKKEIIEEENDLEDLDSLPDLPTLQKKQSIEDNISE